MNAPYYKCEDCGHEFEKTDFVPDVEDALVSVLSVTAWTSNW